MNGARNKKVSMISLALSVDKSFKTYLLEFRKEDIVEAARVLFPKRPHVATCIGQLIRLIDQSAVIKAKGPHSLNIGRRAGEPLVFLDIFLGIVATEDIDPLSVEIGAVISRFGRSHFQVHDTMTTLEVRILWA